MDTFGKRLKGSFLACGLTQTEFARTTGIDYQSMSKFVNDRKIPSHHNLCRIIRYLPGIDYRWLLLGKDRGTNTGG